MSVTKKKPHKAHKPARARTVKPRRHRLHVPPGGSFDVQPDLDVAGRWSTASSGAPASAPARPTAPPGSASRSTTAVDSLLNTPQGALVGADPTRDGKPLDPNGDDTDLVLAWVDRMVRTTNPLVERMTFFWHRHWANSREAVSPTQLLTTQNALLRKYGDLAANPDASFRDMALEVSKDPSMLRYLNGESNVKGGPNENYGRELMELFALGVNARHHGRQELHRERRRAAREVAHRLVHRRQGPGQREGAVRLRPLVQRPEVAVRQARQLQHRHGRRRRARPGRPRAVHRQQAVGRVHAHAALDGGALAARDRVHRERPQAQAARAQHPHATRSSSSRSTSPT